MGKKDKLLIIDQGTTSTRAFVFDLNWSIIASHHRELTQYFPQLGWVEHDPEEIWSAVIDCCTSVLQSIAVEEIAAIGITNQRETTIVWQRKTGKCIGNAIVWQDRRTSDYCASLQKAGHNSLVKEKTGLLLDPYFSATKIKWLLQQNPSYYQQAEEGELLFGTIDCFLLWRLTAGKVHATDITNASRTMLFNINTYQWDDDLLELFTVPKAMLPEVQDNSDHFGTTTLFGKSLPILAIMGDQQAALLGQACLGVGEAKCTYGTGCFLMINTGMEPLNSGNLLTTIAARTKGRTIYALEGSIYAGGTIIKWLRDQLHLIHDPAETEVLANTVSDNGGVYLVPAFTGLGAPYWDADARGAIFGLTRDTQKAHIVRAGLEAIAYQTKDLLMEQGQLATLKVDGGVTKNNWTMQFLADILQVPIVVSQLHEATSLGVAYLAAINLGYLNYNEVGRLSSASKCFYPTMAPSTADAFYQGWHKAVERIVSP